MSNFDQYLESAQSQKDTFGTTGKYLAVKIEYGTYDRGDDYDERLYQFIQDMGGNYTTDGGDKPEYLYLFDSKRSGLTKEELALAIMDDMGYPIYLKANIDKDEPVEEISRQEIEKEIKK